MVAWGVVLRPRSMSEATRTVVVGCGAWGGKTGKIQVYSLNVASGELELKEQREAGGVAAYMTRSKDKSVLYVADETEGRLSSYRIDALTGKLSPLNEVKTEGRPVYVALHKSGRFLTTCFFEEAKTQVFALHSDGRLGDSVCCLDTGTESHCTVFDSSHDYLFVPTRGANWVGQYRFDKFSGAVSPNDPVHVKERPGAGPRHIVFHPTEDVAYLLNELSLTVSTYRFNRESGTLQVIQSQVPSLPPGTEGGAAADLHVHPNGRYLYTSNRQGEGSTIAIFSIDSDNHHVHLVSHESTRGKTPRNFALDADGSVLIVGNRESDNVSIFDVQEEGRTLSYRGSHAVAPGPFFVEIWDQ